MALELSCREFSGEGSIPRRYSCNGENLSPPLRWSGLPEDAKSLALICHDLDAPDKRITHWLVYNIPADEHSLPEGIPPWKSLAKGMLQGTNDFGQIGYNGPCPPGGTHRYVFTLYALDILLDVEPGLRREELVAAIQGHVLAEGHLTGRHRT